MTEAVPEPRPTNLLPFDYHHEKVALTRMAHWLVAEGWDARLSVPPRRAFSDGDLEGLHPEPLDDAFKSRFNSEDDWKYRYAFYYDQPGNFDLAARRNGETLVVEAKGRSAGNRRGAVAQMIGSLTLARRPDRQSVRYGILLPDDRAWDTALRNTGGLEWIELFRIRAAEPGEIVQGDWADYRSEEPVPA